MTEKDILDFLLTASPFLIGALALILLIRAAPGILAEWRRIEETRNEGRKSDTEAQATITAGAIKAVELAVKGMQESQSQSREFYIGKLEDMRQGMRVLDERIRELEEQVEDKDERIGELEDENKRLHIEIERQNIEIQRLRERLDAKNGLATKREKAKKKE